MRGDKQDVFRLLNVAMKSAGMSRVDKSAMSGNLSPRRIVTYPKVANTKQLKEMKDNISHAKTGKRSIVSTLSPSTVAKMEVMAKRSIVSTLPPSTVAKMEVPFVQRKKKS